MTPRVRAQAITFLRAAADAVLVPRLAWFLDESDQSRFHAIYYAAQALGTSNEAIRVARDAITSLGYTPGEPAKNPEHVYVALEAAQRLEEGWEP